jgi:beta-galactosidase
MAFNGYCLLLVQTNKTPGEIRIKASSAVIEGNEVVIKAE